MAARLIDILGRLPSPKGSPPEREALGKARRALRAAERTHRGQVRDARRALARTEKRHDRALRAAAEALEAAKQREQIAAERGGSVLEAAERGRELAHFKNLRLTDRAVEVAGANAPLSPSVYALVEPGAALVATRQASLARLTAHGGADAELVHELDRHPDRLYLVVEAPELVCVVPCSSDEVEARRFAEVVNVAALNADGFASRRSDAMRAANAELEQIRASAGAEVARLEAELRSVTADTTEVDATRRDLARAEADTEEIDRRRAELAQAELRSIEADLRRSTDSGS